MGAPLLEIRNLSNYFGKICTADNLDLSVEEGVLTSIIGPNGAGKSTLINLLTGNLPVQSGRILFQGQEITRVPVHRRVRLGVCRSFQIVNIFPGLSVAENVLIPALSLAGRSWRPFARVSSERDVRREVDRILERIGLTAERDTPAAMLSHGDQRLLEYTVIGDTVNGHHFFRNGFLGVHKPGLALLVSVRKDLEDRDLYYTICCHIGTRCLQIKKANRFGKFQLHFLKFRFW